MAQLTRIEIWDDVECNSGARVGFISRSDLIKATEFLEVSGTEEFNIELPDGLAVWTYLVFKNVLRPVWDDGTFAEYRIMTFEGSRDSTGALIRTVKALGIRNDMQYNCRMLEFLQADVDVFMHDEYIDITPDDAVDIIMGTNVFPSYFTKGTIEATTRIDLVMDWETPLGALEELARISRSELYVWRNGATDYTIDLLMELNSAAEKPIVHYRKNELTARLRNDLTQTGTRIYPKGEGPQGNAPNIGDTRFQASVVGGAPPIATWSIGHLHATGALAERPQIISEDDQFNGLWIQYDDPPQYVQIVDSEPLNATYPDAYAKLTFGSAVTLAAPILMREDNTGTEMVSLVSPSNIAPPPAGYGEISIVLERLDFPGTVNILSDPFFDQSDAWEVAPDSLGTPTITQMSRPSPYIKYGDHAFRVQGDTDDIVEFDGLTALRSSRVNANSPNLSFQLWAYVVTGKIEFYIELVDDVGNTLMSRWPTLNDDGSYKLDDNSRPVRAASTAIGSPAHLTLEPQNINFSEWMNPGVDGLTLDRIRFYVKILEDSTDVYLDALQVVNSTVIGEKIVRGSSIAKLWDAAIKAFTEGMAEPRFTVDMTSIDLERIDPAAYPYDVFDRGVTLILKDPGLEIDVERRIFSVRRDLLQEAVTNLEIVEP